MAYVETLFGHQDRITGVDAGVRERAVTSGGRDGTVRVWKIVEESQLVFNGKADQKCYKITRLYISSYVKCQKHKGPRG